MAQKVSQNTFIKGLLMDTSPLQLDSATLSNALNATLVTMNGNEVILQNDMGNARVDNAYLPTGYVPIGMKEYGGVIYVAAYNPITNRGQLGSFPSPERRFGSEYEGLISGEINIDDFFTFEPLEDKNYKIEKEFNLDGEDTYDNVKNAINYDIILVPLIKEIKLEGEGAKETENTNIIRAGDKFSIYDGDNQKVIYGEGGIYKYLSNYENILEDNKKAYALKNNILTFSVGILNSQNEFVDITPLLKRFDSSGNLLNLDEASDVYKFNKGYFISSKKPEKDEDPPGTIDDKILIAEREKMAVNTYGQKLVGPMYLKMELNTIKQFDYAIEGYKAEEGEYRLLLYSYYKYNFPDIFYKNLSLTDFLKEYYINCLKYGYPNGSEPRPLSLDYEKAYGPLTYYLFNNLLSTGEIKKGQSELLNENNELLYNELEKLYSTVTKTAIDIKTSEKRVEYKLLPGMTFGGMKNLEATGILDLSKLGSGDFELNHWRYYNADNTLTLTYGWNSYPIPGSRISDISFTFYDTSKSNNLGKIEPSYLLDYRESYNGVFTESFEYNQLGLEEKKLYLVEIKANRVWDDETLKPEETEDTFTEYRFILTTELFNDCYFYNSENFIKDYGKPKNKNGNIFPEYADDNLNYTGEASTYYNKLKVSLDLDLSYDDYTTSTTKQFGNLAKKVGSDNELTYGYTTKYDINCKLNYNLHLENPDYYPFKMNDITTGATYELETIEQSNDGPNNIAPYIGEDTGDTNESVRPEHFTDPVFDLGGHLVVGGSSNHSNPTIDDNLGETSSSEESEESEEQTNVTDISRYFEIKLNNTVENILKKEGSGNPNFTDPDDFYNCDIRFENGLIYGYLNVIQKCVAQGSQNSIHVENAFKSIYDHLEKIFSMYNGYLYGFVIGNGNTNDPHKYLMSITKAPVDKVEYFDAENNNTGSKRGCKYKPNTEDSDWQSNPSYIIQFKSWKDLSKANERESLPYVSFISDSNGNSNNHYFELSKISGGIVDIWKLWNTDDGNYSLVGMINAESLVNEKRKWNNDAPYYDFTLSNQTLYCRIWWKTTDDRYVLFPIMWCNRFVGEDHPYDPASGNVTLGCDSSTAGSDHPLYPTQNLGIRASRYKYNTPLEDSIGKFDEDNIFRNTLNSFYFTLGEEVDIDMFTTKKDYTYSLPYYVILKLFGYIKFNISNIPYESFNNNLLGYLSTYFRGEQIEERLFNFYGIENEYKRSLNDLFEKHYNSPDKIDLLISESLGLKNQDELIMDISGGRISDSEGRPLSISRFYIENEKGELEVNASLGNYFNIDLERKLILLEEKAFTYKDPKYFITCGAEESILGNNKSGKRVKAIFDKKCVAVMDLNYPIFKQLDEDTLKEKNWEQV